MPGALQLHTDQSSTHQKETEVQQHQGLSRGREQRFSQHMHRQSPLRAGNTDSFCWRLPFCIGWWRFALTSSRHLGHTWLQSWKKLFSSWKGFPWKWRRKRRMTEDLLSVKCKVLTWWDDNRTVFAHFCWPRNLREHLHTAYGHTLLCTPWHSSS